MWTPLRQVLIYGKAGGGPCLHSPTFQVLKVQRLAKFKLCNSKPLTRSSAKEVLGLCWEGRGRSQASRGVGIFTAVMGRKSSICSYFYKCFFKGLIVTARGWQSISPINYFQVFFFFFSFFFLARFLLLSLSSRGKLVF